MSSGSDASPSHEMTLLEHFAELRKRVFKAAIGVGLVFVGLTFFMNTIMHRFLEPYYRLLPKGQQTVTYTSITEVFFIYMKIAAVLAIFVASPWLFYQLWAFISPGLTRKERRYAIPFVLATSLFFIAGLFFCYHYVLPFSFGFFLKFNKNYTNIVTLSALWGFEIKLLLALGVTFETPILILLLTRLGIVTTRTLARQWKWVTVIIFTIGAIITPPDAFSQIMVSVPMLALYGIGLAVSWIFRKRPKSLPE